MRRPRAALLCLFLGWIACSSATVAVPNETWIIDDAGLSSIAEDGQMQLHIDLQSRGLGKALHAAPDAYDGSVWVATDGPLLLHFARDGVLMQGTSLGAPAKALVSDLAQDVWLLAGSDLMHVSSDGRTVATRPLRPADDDTVPALAVDAFHERLWLATDEGLYYLSTTEPAMPPALALRGNCTAVALDQRSSRMLAIVDGALVAFEGTERSAWLQPLSVSDERARSAAYDPTDDVFIVETADATLRIAPDGRVLDRTPLVGSPRAATPLRVDPTVALLRPPSGGAISEPFAEIVLRVGAACNDKACDVPQRYLQRMGVDATIGGMSLGEAQIDPSGRVTFPLRPVMRYGENVLTVTVIDMFGHARMLEHARFTLLGRTAALDETNGSPEPRAGTPLPKAANKPPTVSLTSPANGAVFVAGSDIALTATAADADGSIARVEFYRGGTTLIGAATTSPYQFTWTNATAGTYSLTAKAYDDRRASATSSAATIVVVNNQPPSVTLTSPQPGSFAEAGSAVIVSANASDPDGTIASVEFFDGTASIGVAAHAPYQINWSPSLPGVHSISAQATDDRGGVTRSASVNLVVGTPPIVVVTGPAACSVIDGPLDVMLSADAFSNSGKIIAVDFFDNGALVGGTNTRPWRAVLVKASIGDHAITARAMDEHGLTAISRSSTFAVRGQNQLPSVTLAAPSDGARFAFGVPVNLMATASDNDGTISAVEFRLNGIAGALIGRATLAPYTTSWTSVAAGSYTVVAVAYDDRNASSVSAPVHITVDPNTPPIVTVTAPVANARIVAPTNVALAANASDSDGTIVRVDFFADAALVGSSTSPPYGTTWNAASPGTYSITAKAIDNAGGTATSPAVPVTVVSNALPSVVLTATAPGGDYYAPATLLLSADAQDSDGAIAGVDFYADGILIAHASALPYRAVWDGVAAGAHVLTAKATDDAGGVVTSSPVSVNIIAGPSVTIDPALPGATIDDDNVLIRGFVSAPANAAVTVNGAVTHIDDVGRFNANDVALTPGSNTVTVEVTMQDGQSSSQSIVVNSGGTGAFIVHASPTEGLESLEVTFTIENPANTPFKQMLLDLDDDGFPNLILTPNQFVDGKLTLTATYPEGTWLAVLKAYDDQDRVIYSTSKSIVVRIPQILQGNLRAIYDGMLARLRAGNITGALTAFTGSAYEKYSAIFTELQPSLAEIIDQLGEVQEVTFNGDLAEFAIVRNTPDGSQRFMLYMIRSEDGIWRIDGM